MPLLQRLHVWLRSTGLASANPAAWHLFRLSTPFCPPRHLASACLNACRGSRRDATFENVLKKSLVFPDAPAVSPACKDLITRLLHKVGG